MKLGAGVGSEYPETPATLYVMFETPLAILFLVTVQVPWLFVVQLEVPLVLQLPLIVEPIIGLPEEAAVIVRSTRHFPPLRGVTVPEAVTVASLDGGGDDDEGMAIVVPSLSPSGSTFDDET